MNNAEICSAAPGMDLMNHAFCKIQPGKCRLALNGQIAVQTSGGYKTYSVKTNALTNCSSFVSSFGDGFFYVVPAAKVRPGDIVLMAGLPRCVIGAENGKLTVMTYETGCIDTLIPERQMFMGNIYFYSKIVSPMLGFFGAGKDKMSRMLRMMMLSDMMNASGGNAGGSGSAGGLMSGNLMQMMLMQNMMKDMGSSLEGMFEGFDEMEMDSSEDETAEEMRKDK